MASRLDQIAEYLDPYWVRQQNRGMLTLLVAVPLLIACVTGTFFYIDSRPRPRAPGGTWQMEAKVNPNFDPRNPHASGPPQSRSPTAGYEKTYVWPDGAGATHKQQIHDHQVKYSVIGFVLPLLPGAVCLLGWYFVLKPKERPGPVRWLVGPANLIVVGLTVLSAAALIAVLPWMRDLPRMVFNGLIGITALATAGMIGLMIEYLRDAAKCVGKARLARRLRWLDVPLIAGVIAGLAVVALMGQGVQSTTMAIIYITAGLLTVAFLGLWLCLISVKMRYATVLQAQRKLRRRPAPTA